MSSMRKSSLTAWENSVPIRRQSHLSMSSEGPCEDVPTLNVEVPFKNNLEEWNHRLADKWAEIMHQGCYTTSPNYRNIEVLMLSHEYDDDDLGLEDELNRLERVFAELYHFGVTRETIKKRSTKRPQVQVNKIVSSFVYEHDSPNTLLVIYFAGHGTPTDEGTLSLHGHKFGVNELGAEDFNKVVWNNTERNLHKLSADVLQIFDCCYAGLMSNVECEDGQTIEFVAACGENEQTPSPGDSSFTSALILSLEKLAREGGRFTSVSLMNQIEQSPNFDRHRQHAKLIRRARQTQLRPIFLHALSPSGDRSAEADQKGYKHQESPDASEEQYSLELRFHFNSRPSDNDIIHLAEDLNKIVAQRRLPMSHIAWRGIIPKESTILKATRILIDRREIAAKRERNPEAGPLLRATQNFSQALNDKIDHQVQEALSQASEERRTSLQNEAMVRFSLPKLQERPVTG